MLETLNWFMAHWPEIVKVIGELTAALLAMAAAITGLCSVLVTKVIPVLAHDHPALPWVKIMASVSIVKPPPVSPEERPVTRPPDPPVTLLPGGA